MDLLYDIAFAYDPCDSASSASCYSLLKCVKANLMRAMADILLGIRITSFGRQGIDILGLVRCLVSSALAKT